MPITQEQMLEQVRESRANHAEMRALRELVLNYIGHLRTTYLNNLELQEAMTALEYTIRLRAIPDDRATYMNERYYQRFGKRNADAKQRQALMRAGVIQPRERKYRAKKIRAEMDEATPPRHVGKAPIFPRDDPDDKELEFDLPPGATLDVGGPKLLDENNLLTGVDIAADLGEDSNGNDAKESGE